MVNTYPLYLELGWVQLYLLCICSVSALYLLCICSVSKSGSSVSGLYLSVPGVEYRLALSVDVATFANDICLGKNEISRDIFPKNGICRAYAQLELRDIRTEKMTFAYAQLNFCTRVYVCGGYAVVGITQEWCGVC